MSTPDRTPHAIHNEELCDFLLQNNNFYDWIVTTAFYSSLHFVQSKIFPVTLQHPGNGNNINIDCFEIYYSLFKKSIRKSKHEATVNLVSNYLPGISTDYRRLFDTCMSARYNNYQVNPSTAISARERLRRIKAACTQNATTVTII
jgi:hypothetical protein